MPNKYFKSTSGSYRRDLEKAIESLSNGDILHENRGDSGWEVHVIYGKAFIFWQCEAPSHFPQFVAEFNLEHYGDIADKLQTLT